MFAKPKPTVNVEAAINVLMKLAGQDETFASVLKGIMAQNAVRMQAMVKAWVEELRKKAASQEMIDAVASLENMEVAKKVRNLLITK